MTDELKWEKLEDTKLINWPNILAVDCDDVYRLGRLYNGRFYERNFSHYIGYREVKIVKYVELPDLEE